MKSEPCVRFAILISPKMSEKPAANRNSRPPSARLFSVWIAQYCTQPFVVPAKAGTHDFQKRNWAPAFAGATISAADSRLQVLRRRIVARVRRVLEVLLRLVGPELAHVRIGVHDRVHQASFLARHATHVHVAHNVAVLVE